jgi:outer membrane biosynthesis protein TonB
MRKLCIWIAFSAVACLDSTSPAPVTPAPVPTPVDPVDVPDRIDRAIITAGIAPVRDAAPNCASRAPNAHGVVKIHIVVGTDGSVTAADVATTPDAALGECVLALARASTYAQTQPGGSFMYPFMFEP